MVMEFLVPGMPAIIAATGADFALFDMEHTGASLETMKAMVAGCRGIGLAPLVRVPRGEYHFIARALDIGAHGVMVPMVNSAAEAAHIAPARTIRRPAGAVPRSAWRMTTIARPIPPPPWHERPNAQLVIAQIETMEGLRDVEAIAATPGIDVVWLGHFDLSNFMGIPGQFQHPDFLAAVHRTIAAARTHGKVAGVHGQRRNLGARILGPRVPHDGVRSGPPAVSGGAAVRAGDPARIATAGRPQADALGCARSAGVGSRPASVLHLAHGCPPQTHACPHDAGRIPRLGFGRSQRPHLATDRRRTGRHGTGQRCARCHPERDRRLAAAITCSSSAAPAGW